MTDPQLPAESISSAERQRAVDRLCAHFAQDNMDETELERRLDLAYAARTKNELVAIERDLPALTAEVHPPANRPVPAPGPSPLVDPTLPVNDRDFMVAIMGGTGRKGHWVPPRKLTCLSLMGGAELDFRDATFATPEIDVTLFTIMGGAEIIVPPGVRVEWNGVAIMGGFGAGDRMPADPNAPLIRINGLVLMGGVEIVERYSGETAKEARERLRAYRKAARQLPPSPSDGRPPGPHGIA